jgi:penicillin-binding protein 1A
MSPARKTPRKPDPSRPSRKGRAPEKAAASWSLGPFFARTAAQLTRPRNLLFAATIAIVSGAGIGLAMVYVPDASQVRVLEDYKPSVQVILYDDEGNIFAELEALERRKLVAYNSIPEQLRNAVLAVEDSRFFWHVGVDPVGVLGAFYDNFTQGFGERGASTITMQLARGLGWSSPEKTPSRKLVEAFYYALQTERYFSKERILELYMNQVFMGHDVYGFGAAAEFYFDKELDELTLSESALLAGMLQRPNDYYPLHQNMERAARRRNIVLRRMLTEGYITEEEHALASNEPIAPAAHDRSEELGAYFTEEIRRKLYGDYGTVLYESGLRVNTTLNTRIQAAAERALDLRLREVDKRHGWRGVQRNLRDEGADPLEHREPRWERPIRQGDYVPAVVVEVTNAAAHVRIADRFAEITREGAAWTRPTRPSAVRLAEMLAPGDLISVQVVNVSEEGALEVTLDQEPEIEGAILVIENYSGEVKAEVGGHRFDNSEFNRARQAVRQTGSAFKPFVYGAALSNGWTAGSLMLDQQMQFVDPSTRQPYKPSNYGNEYVGITTTSEALAKSRNVIAVALQEQVGADKVIDFARRLGITANLRAYLSLALGVVDVSLWEMTRAYAVFPNGGVRVEPHRIKAVIDREGRPVEVTQRRSEQVMSADVAYLMTRMLTNVIEYSYAGGLQGGSGRRAQSLARDLRMPLAGKTGTTDNSSDAWFLGFSPYHTIGVWVGNDTKKPIGPGEEGAKAALPIWMDVMRAASEGLTSREFERPGGVVLRTVDARTGLLSSDVCGSSIIVAFIEGTEPTRVCGPEEARILAMNHYQQAYFIDRIGSGR